MRFLTPTIILVSTCLFLTGCSSKNALIGKWQGSYKGIPTILELGEKNKLVIKMDRGDTIGVLEGTYYIKDNKLGFTIETISGNGTTIKAPDNVKNGYPDSYEVTETTLRMKDRDSWVVLKRIKD